MSENNNLKMQQGHIQLIDYLKAVAIILVIINHSMINTGKDGWLVYFFVRMAVPMFVLISGFNYTASIEKMGSPIQWFQKDRLFKKMKTYLVPMVVVFVLWCTRKLIEGKFTIERASEKLILQNYGFGAYYFLIVVQLYLMFPLVYYLIRKYGKKGYLLVFLANLMYEIILAISPIEYKWYRIIGVRYLFLLACGCWLYDCFCGEKDVMASSHDVAWAKDTTPISRKILLATSFVIGVFHILFFVSERKDRDLFHYASWGNTNLFVSFYIVPILYIILKMFWDKTIRVKWLDELLSMVGQSSYYILCTQMIMFWYIDDIWEATGAPIAVRMVCDATLGVGSGLLVNRILKLKSLCGWKNGQSVLYLKQKFFE